MTQTHLFAPRIPTGRRSVFPKGKDVAPVIRVLYLLPLGAALIAVADDRLGFRLFMAGLAATTLLLVAALQLWNRALRAGSVRVVTSGPLRFVPPPYLRPLFAIVAIAFLIPAVVSLVVALLGLPTMGGSTRFTTVLPYLLAVVSLVSLVRLLWSMRTPAGLRVDAEGLSGVRGSKRVQLAWNDLDGALAPGPHGPTLALLTRTHGPISIDAHHIGSDPAVVAGVIQHYLDHPAQRFRLEDGMGAIRAVEGLSR